MWKSSTTGRRPAGLVDYRARRPRLQDAFAIGIRPWQDPLDHLPVDELENSPNSSYGQGHPILLHVVGDASGEPEEHRRLANAVQQPTHVRRPGVPELPDDVLHFRPRAAAQEILEELLGNHPLHVSGSDTRHEAIGHEVTCTLTTSRHHLHDDDGSLCQDTLEVGPQEECRSGTTRSPEFRRVRIFH